MIAAESMLGGFSDPVFQSQTVFRKVLEAFARPGTHAEIPGVVAAPTPLHLATAAFICTFADGDTPIFFDRAVGDADAALAWIRFHTDAPIVDEPQDAAFAIIVDPGAMPAFDRFSVGTAEYPDRSTTIVLQVEELSGAPGLTLEGPGIDGAATINARPLPADFVEQLHRNRALFPCGVDLVLASPQAVVALPRSLRVSQSREA